MKERHWQNLIHKKCPNCDARFLPHPRGFYCPDDKCAFFITRLKLVQILTDPTHPALMHMSPHELDILDTALRDLGVVPSEFWQTPVIENPKEL